VTRAGGGTLIEHSIHDVDVMQWVLGPIVSVSATTAETFGHRGIEDVAVLRTDFASGVGATLSSVWHQVMTRPSTRRVELFCESAMLWTEDDFLGPLHVETSEGAEEHTAGLPEWAAALETPEVFAKAVAAYAAPAKAFLDALTRDGSAARGSPTVADALAAHEVVEAAYRSAAAGGAPIAPAR